MLAAFVWRESRARVPLLPLGIFRLRALTAANGATVLTSMIMGAVILLLSLQLQDLDGLSPLSAGLALAGAPPDDWAVLTREDVTPLGARRIAIAGPAVVAAAG